jgi:hypothetical protein
VARYRDVQWNNRFRPEDPLMDLLPFQNNRRVTKRTGLNIKVNGKTETFIVEAFNSTYEIFVLLCPETELKRATVA